MNSISAASISATIQASLMTQSLAESTVNNSATTEPPQVSPSHSLPGDNHDYPAIIAAIRSMLPQNCPQNAEYEIRQCLEYKVRSTVITELQDPAQFSQLPLLRQTFAMHLEALQTMCRNNAQPQQPPTEDISSAISRHAKAIATKETLREKRRIISEWLQSGDADQLAGNALDQAYRQCQSDKKLANSVTSKLEKLIELADIPASFESQYRLSIRYVDRGDELDGRFCINLPRENFALGYGIFDLLHSQGIHTSGDDYDGETVFSLTRTQLTNLNSHTEELNKWYDDFLCIVGDLLGQDNEAGDASEQFVSVGKKSVREILVNPIRLSTHCQELFATLPPQQPCLLFNTLSINLANHPDRHFLRQKIESIYAEEDIIGANQLRKAFIRGTFSTNLNVAQLQVISPHLNKLLKLQQLLTDVTGTESLGQAIQAYQVLGLGDDEIDPFRCFKTSLLYEIYQELKGSDVAAFRTIERAMQNMTSISQLESKARLECEAILRTHSVCCFPEPERQLSIDDQQALAVYGDHDRNTTYRGNQVHRNISALCLALQNSHAYRDFKAHNGHIDEALNLLQRDLTGRLHRYADMNTTSANSRFMLDEAVGYFETFVALLCHKDEYHLTPSSISSSLNNLAGIADSGLGGCNQGLSGRVQSLLWPLVGSSANQIKDSIVQFHKDGIAASLAEAFGNFHESSMSARCVDEVNNFLGLAVVRGQNPNITFAQLSRASKSTISHLLHKFCTPVALYRHVYQFLSDEFWRLNHEKNDDDIYQLLHVLGFADGQATTADDANYRRLVDHKYRVRGNALNRWQYAFFQQDLPKHLVSFLIKEKFISANPAIEGTVLIPRDKLLFGTGTVTPRPDDPNAAPQHSGPESHHRELGFVPESRMIQASYRTETS